MTKDEISTDEYVSAGRDKRSSAVTGISSKIEQAKSIIFADYHGLSASQVNELRANLRKSGAQAGVIKNTLLKIALKDNKLESEELFETLNGPTIAVFSNEDELSGIKDLFEFAKDHDVLKVKSGLFEGKFIGTQKLEMLSKLPSRDELLGQVVSTMKSPINDFVGVLGGTQRKLVYALSAIADQKNDN